MSDYSINIVHIYPDLLNLYGDKGNIECMKKRLVWRGIDANVKECTVNNSDIAFENTDIIFLGGGSDREQEIVCSKLLKYKNEISDFIEKGGCMLAACGGFQMLGKYYETTDKKVEGLGVLNITAGVAKDKTRIMGNVVLKSDITDGFIVGFENHISLTDIGKYSPLGEVVCGGGNNGTSRQEGLVYKNLIATNLHGPLLPKNPQLCDYILKKALNQKYSSFSELEKLDDATENAANNYIVQAYTR